jgi:ABC-type bacteriocin/lantibiotic exporter with double-glycine peptidase domain
MTGAFSVPCKESKGAVKPNDDHCREADWPSGETFKSIEQRRGSMIQLTNIQKSFGKNQVLKGIDLTVQKGDVVVVLGPSGSGKTTLLRCVNFLERPNEGEITICDYAVDCKHASKKDILLRKVLVPDLLAESK